MNLNQERKISSHLRESGEVLPGVHGILRRKKARAFQHFLENKNKKTNHKPRWHFHQLQYLWTVSSRRTSFFKVKCQSRTYYLELIYLLLLLNAHALLKGCTYTGKQCSSTQTCKAPGVKNPTSTLYMLQQLLCQTSCNLVRLTECLLAAGLH